MAPKAPSASKTNALLALIRKSNTAHTLKELEKSASGPTGINGMQLKDHIQALLDENLIRVEKIGSGNWYWSFMSEEKQARTTMLDRLQKETNGLETRVEELRNKVRARQETEQELQLREEWQQRYQGVKDEVETLQQELRGYEDVDPMAFEELKTQTTKSRSRAELWTDNVLLLEAYFLELSGGDKQALENVRATLYGIEYVEGEGLREL